ncbi:metallophosphoesterase family protein [Aquabacter sp. CN5-332]
MAVQHCLPENRLVYAIADLHGRADLLQLAAEAIAKDMADAPGADTLTVFLGDYVDRGPNSADVIERLSAGDFPTPIVALLGNHEYIMRQAWESDPALLQWCDFGGLPTLFSYGVDVRGLQRGTNIAEARSAFCAALPPRHRLWLENLRSSFELGDYFFCHAGVRPDVALSDQAIEDLIWIREAFTSSGKSHGKFIVHGHTPVMEPDVRDNRINIDTGACMTGKLTILRLQGETRRLMQVSAKGLRPAK